MKFKAVLLGCTMAFGVVAGAMPANAENVFRWARQGDALTMDPHSQNEGPTNALSQQIFDPLVERNNDLGLSPGLALSWEPIDEDTWEFVLRQGVTFHDGAAFDASDAVFSLERARSDTSDYRNYLSSVTTIEQVDDFTIHINTDGPNPILPNQLTYVMMMDEGWSVTHGVEVPQDYAAGEETFAVRNTNGTGAFILESREPEVRTVMVKNENYWGADEVPLEIDRIVLTPIAADATRIAALLSGELDFVLDPPVQDLQRLDNTDGVKVETVDENRVIFLGMNMAADDLEGDNVDGANPFADIRVRQAMYQAIDIEAIREIVMNGQAVPAGVIMPTFVHGWTQELDTRMAYDPEASRTLLAEAGYGDGFSTTMFCPNDRYVNDEAVCQAVVGMLGQVGIDIDLIARTRSVHFQDLQNRLIDFYMLGWGVPTFDSEYIFNFLYHTDDGNRGTWNATGFSDARMDELIGGMNATVDLEARDAMIAEAWAIAQENMVYLPLHHQVINWATAEEINLPVRADNIPSLKWVSYSN